MSAFDTNIRRDVQTASTLILSSDQRTAALAPLARAGLTRWIIVIAAILASLWPLLGPFFADLRDRPAYALYPVLILAAAVLAMERLRELPFDALRPGRWVCALLGLVSALALLAIGAMFYVRWFAAPATLLAIAGLAWRIGGPRLFRALLPAGVLLLTILPPPLRGETHVTVALQRLAVHASSRLLDVLAIPHVQTGNVLIVRDHRLLIEEACSGINSVIAVAAFTLLLGFWRHRRPIWIAALLPLGLVFVLWLNVLRITLGAAALAWWRVDLFSYTVHEWLGLIMFGCGTALVLSADAGIELMSAAWPTGPTSNQTSPPTSPRATTILPVRATPATHAPGIVGWTLAAAFLAVGATSLWRLRASWPAPQLAGDATFRLPVTIGAWTLLGPSDASASVTTTAMHTRHWTYRANDEVVEVAIAYPFTTWFHDPSICYAQAGWTVVAQSNVDAPSPDAGLASKAFLIELAQVGDRFASVLYTDFSERGAWQPPLPPPGGNRWAQRLELTRRAAHYQPACEVQVLCVRNAPLTPADRERLQQLFAGVRDALRNQVIRLTDSETR